MKNILLIAAALFIFAACSKDDDNNSDNSIKNNEIKYTSKDGRIIEPCDLDGDTFGANIVSNTYENGIGTITFDGKVTRIPRYAFYNRGYLTSITLPESVVEIGRYAFYNTNVNSLIIPSNVKYVEACGVFGTIEFKPLNPPILDTTDGSRFEARFVYVPAKSFELYKEAYKGYYIEDAIVAK